MFMLQHATVPHGLNRCVVYAYYIESVFCGYIVGQSVDWLLLSLERT